MKVTILIPVVRKESAARAIAHAIFNAGVDVLMHAVEDKERIGCPRMVKKMTDKTTTDYVCFLGDDTIPQPGYMRIALEEMKELPYGEGLIGFNDKTGRTLPTHWLASKKLLPLIGGEFFHTGYQHCCCDVELMERALSMGRFKYSQKAIVLHDHPMLTGKKSDEFYDYVYSDPVRKKDQELLRQRRHLWQ
jgi:GT2 family glycosyltransferase